MPPVSPAPIEASEAVAAAPQDGEPSGFDESAEAAFLGEARDRAEPVRNVTPAQAAAEMDEADSKPLPPLDSLVQQIPADVRATLEELFRAKFIRVQRVPRKALKL
ncbi:MAG TPA: hypothetical protein VM029_09690 [Opitutaceae bacterium]|nr:hypothetical protein [Opitutaceae bacterium]